MRAWLRLSWKVTAGWRRWGWFGMVCVMLFGCMGAVSDKPTSVSRVMPSTTPDGMEEWATSAPQFLPSSVPSLPSSNVTPTPPPPTLHLPATPTTPRMILKTPLPEDLSTPIPDATSTPSPTYIPYTPVPDAGWTVETLLAEPIEPYCRSRQQGCTTSLLYKLIDYFVQHPELPGEQRLLLLRRARYLGTWPYVGMEQRHAHIEWLFPEWIEAEFQALQIAPGVAATDVVSYTVTGDWAESVYGEPAIELGRNVYRFRGGDFDVYPTDLDGDGVQDYVVSATASPYGHEFGSLDYHTLVWMQWDGATWRSGLQDQKYLASNHKRGSVVLVDLEGDGHKELAWINESCTASECVRTLTVAGIQDQALKTKAILSEGAVGRNTALAPTRFQRSVGGVVWEYEYRADEFVPVQTSAPDTVNAYYALQLAYESQFDQAQALFVEQERTGRAQTYADHKSFVKLADIRPTLLFNAGFVAVWAGQPEAAQHHWQQVLELYPDSPVAESLKINQWLSFAPSATEVCETLHQQQPMWLTPEQPTDQPFVDPQPYTWRSLCLTTFAVDQHDWNTGQPLAEHFEALHVQWEELSAAYDFNNDGRADFIGLTTWIEQRDLWIFLTTDTGYVPWLPAQQWSQGEQLKYFYDQRNYWWFNSGIQNISIEDMNNDHQPELLSIEKDRTWSLREWKQDRFVRSYRSQIATVPPEYLLTGLHVDQSIQPSQIHVQYTHPETGHVLSEPYIWKDSALLSPVNAPLHTPYVSLLNVRRTLFWEADPAAALILLDQVLQNPDTYRYEYHSLHELTALRAYALTSLGQTVEAQNVWRTLAESAEKDEWSVLAQSYLK